MGCLDDNFIEVNGRWHSPNCKWINVDHTGACCICASCFDSLEELQRFTAGTERVLEADIEATVIDYAYCIEIAQACAKLVRLK